MLPLLRTTGYSVLAWLFLMAVDATLLYLFGDPFIHSIPGARLEGELQLSHWLIGMLTYYLVALGLTHFVILSQPLGRPRQDIKVFLEGAVLGAVIYGAYEGSNYVLLKDWPILLVWADLTTGLFLCAVTSLFVFQIRKMLKD